MDMIVYVIVLIVNNANNGSSGEYIHVDTST